MVVIIDGALKLVGQNESIARLGVILSMGMGGMYSLEELVSIEETSVPDAAFEVPAGFTKKSLSELWGIG